MNFAGFCEFYEVLWIFLDFMTCSSLVLDFYVSFLVFFRAFEIDFNPLSR